MSKANVEFIRSVLEAFLVGDLRAFLSALDADVEWHGPDDLPWGGLHRGPAAVETYFAREFDAFDDLNVLLRDYVDAGHQVVTVSHVSGRGRATGREFSVPCVHVWTIRAGKITSMHCHTDTAPLLRALHLGSESR